MNTLPSCMYFNTGLLVDQLLLPTACKDCPGLGAILPSAVVGVGMNQSIKGGLCLAGLLASTPGPRPWSGDMRGHSRVADTLWRVDSLGSLLHVSWNTVTTSCFRQYSVLLSELPSEGQCSLATSHTRSTSSLIVEAPAAPNQCIYYYNSQWFVMINFYWLVVFAKCILPTSINHI